MKKKQHKKYQPQRRCFENFKMIYCKIYINVLIFLCWYILYLKMLLKIDYQHTDYAKLVLIWMLMKYVWRLCLSWCLFMYQNVVLLLYVPVIPIWFGCLNICLIIVQISFDIKPQTEKQTNKSPLWYNINACNFHPSHIQSHWSKYI